MRQRAAISGGVILCWLAVTYSQLEKYLDRPIGLIAAVLAACVVWLAVEWLRRQYRRGSDWGYWALYGVVVILAMLFAALFPLSQRHVAGAGSDRLDALRLAVEGVVRGHSPYAQATFLGNRISPMPGAALIAAPWYLAAAAVTRSETARQAAIAFQNVLWMVALAIFGVLFFRWRLTAFAFLVVMFLCSGLLPNDYASGGDYNTNAIYALIALVAVVVAFECGAHLIWQAVSVIFLGLALSSRPTYLVLLPLAVAGVRQHAGWLRAAMVGAGASFTAVVVTLPFYLADPEHFAPLHTSWWLDPIPAPLHAAVLLPALAFAVALAVFFVQITTPRIILLLALAQTVLLLPPVVAWLIDLRASAWSIRTLPFLAPGAIYFALWLFHMLEDGELRPGVEGSQPEAD